MIHGHEVLHMMENNSYATRKELIDAIIRKFGKGEKFFTCCTENMTAEELVDFLEQRGKFVPTTEHKFTVNKRKICNS